MASLDSLAARILDSAFLQPMRSTRERFMKMRQGHPWDVWPLRSAKQYKLTVPPTARAPFIIPIPGKHGTYCICHNSGGVCAGACILCEIVPGAWTCFFHHWWLFRHWLAEQTSLWFQISTLSFFQPNPGQTSNITFGVHLSLRGKDQVSDPSLWRCSVKLTQGKCLEVKGYQNPCFCCSNHDWERIRKDTSGSAWD